VPHTRIEEVKRLRRLLDAVLLLEKEINLPSMLQHFVEEARDLTQARYAALGVLDESGTGLADFITTGLSDDEKWAKAAASSGF
jgi:hypothetical protein